MLEQIDPEDLADHVHDAKMGEDAPQAPLVGECDDETDGEDEDEDEDEDDDDDEESEAEAEAEIVGVVETVD